MRWWLLLEEFKVTIVDKLVKSIVVIDFLSHIKYDGDYALVQDGFQDKNMSSISIKTPWFVDIANYLAIVEVPPHFWWKQKKCLIRESSPFKWIDVILCLCGPNMVLW